MTLLEISANIFILISVYLANRNSIHTWWTGIIATILFGFLFYEVKLYADVTLQIFFTLTSIFGWWKWLRGGSRKQSLPISRVKSSLLLIFTVIAVLLTFGYGYLLFNLTEASYPLVDSTVLFFSILAQFFLMERKLETWIFWILVDVISVPLFASKELYLTSIIYFAFLINAIWGLWNWIKIYRLEYEKIS